MKVVDARGLACPLPVLRLAAAARDVPDGTELTVLWTDPAAAHDIPAWARMRGHRVVTSPLPTEAGSGEDPAEPLEHDEVRAVEGTTTVRVVRP